MKKVYTKPLAVMEDISLSEHIAACDANISNSSANNVDFSIEDLRFAGYFTSGESCSTDLDNSERPFERDGKVYCYHTSVGTSSTSVFVFSS